MPDIQTEVIGCCGLSGINNLNTGCDHDPDCDCEQDGDYSSIRDAMESNSHKGIVIAVTNKEQEDDGIGIILQRNGFHPVLNTLNTNSSNRITLWVKDHTEGKVPANIYLPPTHGSLLKQAVEQYVQSNPNPHSRSAQRLVNRYKELFPEQASS
jgi:hypothetical protein